MKLLSDVLTRLSNKIAIWTLLLCMLVSTQAHAIELLSGPTLGSITSNGTSCDVAVTYEVRGTEADQVINGFSADRFFLDFVNTSNGGFRSELERVEVGQTQSGTVVLSIDPNDPDVDSIYTVRLYDSVFSILGSFLVSPSQLIANSNSGDACDILGNRSSGSNSPPIVQAQDDVTVTVQDFTATLTDRARAVLTLDNVSDADGDNLSFSWVQLSGPTSEFQAPTSLDLTGQGALIWQPNVASTQVWQVTVDDGRGGTATDTVAVTWEAEAVVAPNNPPTVVANSSEINPTIPRPNDPAVQVSFDTIGSSDPDGDILTYSWVLTFGPDSTSEINPNVEGGLFVNPPAEAGSQRWTVTADDGNGGTDTTFVSINWLAPRNRVPIAVAGPDVFQLSAPAGDPDVVITLDPSGSSDPDDDDITFEWVQISGPASSVASNGSIEGAIDVTQPANFGVQQWRLFVSDPAGLQGIDNVTVEWADPTNNPPTVQASNETTLNIQNANGVGTVLTRLRLTASDPDSDELSYRWTLLSGPANRSPVLNGSSPSLQAPDEPVTEVWELEVTDGRGGRATGSHTINWLAPLNIPPIADTGSDQNLMLADQTVTLNGSGSRDPEGEALSYSWTQIGGPTVTLTGADTVSPSFDVDATDGEAQYRFQLIVNDGVDNSVPVQVNVNIGVNNAPIANAGEDRRVLIENPQGDREFVLDGSQSSDPGGNALTYAWTQVSGRPVTLTGADTVNPTVTASMPLAGASNEVFTFNLVVSNGALSSQVDSVTIRLVNNLFLTIDAGEDQTVMPSDFVTLSAAGSSDTSGSPLTYSWEQIVGQNVTLSNPNAVSPTFTAPSLPSTLIFRLTLSSASGTGIDDVRVRAEQPTNAPPVANAGEDQTLEFPPASETFTLDGSSSSDLDGDTLTYAWRQRGSRSLNITGADTPTPTVTYDFGASAARDDVFIFELEVSDGQRTSTDQVTVTFSANALPIADAGQDQRLARIAPSETFSLDGTGSSDAEGAELSYAWQQVSGRDLVITGADTATPSVTFDGGGAAGIDDVFTFALVVNDGFFDSVVDQVTIAFEGSPVPIADAGEDQVLQSLNLISNRFTLDGTGSSSASGGTLSYAWTQTSGRNLTLTDEDTARPTIVYDQAGNLGEEDVFTFALVVNDGTFSSEADEVTITIVTTNRPVADAGEDQILATLADGETFSLSGSATSDRADADFTYRWEQRSGRVILDITGEDTATPTVTYDGAAIVNIEDVFTFSLVVNDGLFDSAADEVSVTIQTNERPVADAGEDQQGVNSGDIVTLTAAASSDPEGADITYQWTQTSGPSVTLSDATSVSPSFTAPFVTELTDFTFEVTVFDPFGVQAKDSVTVSVQAVGSITIIQLVSGGDDEFSFSSDVDALNTTLTTISGTGQLFADDVVAGTYNITAGDARDRGFALTALSCNDTDSTTNISSRSVTLNLSAGEDLICTFESVNTREAAQTAIRESLVQRNKLLLSNQPNSQRRLDRLNGRVSSGSGVNLAGLQVVSNGVLPISAQWTENGASLATSLVQLNSEGSRPIGKAPRTGKGSIDVWGEATIAQFNSAGKDGDFGLIYLGADYVASDTVLVGALVQLDSFNTESNSRIGDTDGNGFMVGPYATVKLSDKIYVDGRVAWGESDNSISPLGQGEDEFETSRFLSTLSITGDFNTSKTVNIRPTLGLRHISETQKSYRDSFGVPIPEQNISLGEVSFAPRVEKSIALNNGWVLKPYGAVEGIVSFGDEVENVIENDFRARIEAGANIQSDTGVRGGISAFTDGLGQDNYNAQGIRVTFTYTMK